MLIKVNQLPFNKKKMNLVVQPFFKEFLFFLLLKKDQVVTLKDIKKEFPNAISLNSFIDELIEFGIIHRYHGRYSFSGILVTKECQQKLNQFLKTELDSNKKILVDWIKKFKEQNTDDVCCLMLFYKLFSECESDSLAIYEKTDLSINWLNLPSRLAEVKSKNMTIFSMANFAEMYGNNIADYFNFLTVSQENLPKSYWSVYHLLGDLNPNYFNQHANRHIRRLEKGKGYSNKKRDIFMETLLLMGYVQKEEDDYHLTIKRVTRDIDWSVLDEIIQQLAFGVDSIDVQTSQKDFIIRSIFVLWLIDNQLISLPTFLNGML